MRGELAFFLLVLCPALMAPKGCYYGSDLVPLGYNATGGSAEAGAFGSEDAGESSGASASTESAGGACNAGASSSAGAGPAAGAVAGTNSDAGNGGSGGTSTGGAGAGHGGTIVIVLRPH